MNANPGAVAAALLLVALALTSALAGAQPSQSPLAPAETWAWQLVARHEHDPQRFTQGLQFFEGRWLESSGGFGNSFVLLEEADAERPEARLRLPPQEFGEGVTWAGEHIWLITWRAGVARKLTQDLEEISRYRYGGQGWGLTWDGERLIMSDGSDRLQFRHPDDFRLLGTLAVRDGMRRVGLLNELEYAHGLVWANVFGRNRIAAIDPGSGAVRGWLDLRTLAEDFDKPPGWDPRNNLLNGIAVDEATGHLHVTGKRWPVRYEIRVSLPEDLPAAEESQVTP